MKEFRCGGASLNSASPATLSAAFFLRELVHALMGQPEKTSGIARAHLQFSGSQDQTLIASLLHKYATGRLKEI